MKLEYFIFIGALVLSACSRNDKDHPVDTPSHVIRKDLKAPVISQIQPGSYIDESSGQRVDFKEKIVFKKFVTNWKRGPRVSELNLEENRKHLPYFMVTVEDEDTAASDIIVDYDIMEDNALGETTKVERHHYRRAERLKSSNQWVIILSEETVGHENILTAFTGERKFILHLRATDSTNNKSFKELEFWVINLKPPLTITVYTDKIKIYTHADSDEFRPEKLRTGESHPEKVIFSKVFVENQNANGMYVKISFDGILDYKFQRWNQSWVGDRFVSTLLSQLGWKNAPVTSEVMEWDAKTQDMHVARRENFPGHESIFGLPPYDISSGEKGRSALVLSLSTHFGFQNREPEEKLNDSLSPNVYVDALKVIGNLKILTAPKEMLPEFYGVPQNWNDHSQSLFSMSRTFISN